jgi:hypothetical protein
MGRVSPNAKIPMPNKIQNPNDKRLQPFFCAFGLDIWHYGLEPWGGE